MRTCQCARVCERACVHARVLAHGGDIGTQTVKIGFGLRIQNHFREWMRCLCIMDGMHYFRIIVNNDHIGLYIYYIFIILYILYNVSRRLRTRVKVYSLKSPIKRSPRPAKASGTR